MVFIAHFTRASGVLAFGFNNDGSVCGGAVRLTQFFDHTFRWQVTVRWTMTKFLTTCESWRACFGCIIVPPYNDIEHTFDVAKVVDFNVIGFFEKKVHKSSFHRWWNFLEWLSWCHAVWFYVQPRHLLSGQYRFQVIQTNKSSHFCLLSVDEWCNARSLQWKRFGSCQSHLHCRVKSWFDPLPFVRFKLKLVSIS